MAKVKSTASEVQLKARRTSLGKKSNEELINIILRKDKSERSMNSKIQELTGLLKEVVRLKKVCNFRRKAILTCFGIIAILLIFIVLSF